MAATMAAMPPVKRPSPWANATVQDKVLANVGRPLPTSIGGQPATLILRGFAANGDVLAEVSTARPLAPTSPLSPLPLLEALTGPLAVTALAPSVMAPADAVAALDAAGLAR